MKPLSAAKSANEKTATENDILLMPAESQTTRPSWATNMPM